MLIAHSRPPDIAFALTDYGSGASGAAWLTDVALATGRPGQVTRGTWCSSGALITRGIQVTASFAAGCVPRFVGLFGTNLPAGLSCTLLARATGAGSFAVSLTNYQQRIVELPSGARLVLFVQPATFTTACDAVALVFLNDVAGATALAPSAEFELGEIFVGAGDDIEIETDWGLEEIDPTVVDRSESQQPFVQRGTPRTDLTFTPSNRDETELFGDASALSATDWQELASKLNRGKLAVFVPRYKDLARAYSPQNLHRTAVLGTMTKHPGLRHLSGPQYGHGEMQVQEAPIPV